MPTVALVMWSTDTKKVKKKYVSSQAECHGSIDYTTRNLYPRVDANVSPLIDVFKIHDFSLLCNEYLK